MSEHSKEIAVLELWHHKITFNLVALVNAKAFTMHAMTGVESPQ
jgi:hypothetical protein